MKTVLLRGVEIGAGAPKLVVPIACAGTEELIARAREQAGGAADVVEWRADFFAFAPDADKTLDALAALREALGGKPLLFTFRTAAQGGEREIGAEDYAALCIAAARSGRADAVDVELCAERARDIAAAAHDAGTAVVGSWHDFAGTPPRAEMLDRLLALRDMGADVLKLAVMARARADVLELLHATERASRTLDRPVVTMAMSPLGAVSRVCGGAFGSAMTFGAAGRASAPGQLPAVWMREALDLLYGAENDQR